MFVLQYVQPGLAGLMDGSVSTLAPLFPAAFATHNTWATFLVGLAAAVGAGISMGFAEAYPMTARSPARRAADARRGLRRNDGDRRLGQRCLISFRIFTWRPRWRLPSWRSSCRDLLDPHPLYGYAVLQAAFQVVVGGVLVFAAGILIGSS